MEKYAGLSKREIQAALEDVPGPAEPSEPGTSEPSPVEAPEAPKPREAAPRITPQSHSQFYIHLVQQQGQWWGVEATVPYRSLMFDPEDQTAHFGGKEFIARGNSLYQTEDGSELLVPAGG